MLQSYRAIEFNGALKKSVGDNKCQKVAQSLAVCSVLSCTQSLDGGDVFCCVLTCSSCPDGRNGNPMKR